MATRHLSKRRGRPQHSGMGSTQVVEDFEPIPMDGLELVATLTVLTGDAAGTLHAVDHEVIIGRADDAPLRILDPGLSRFHARVYREGQRYFLEDLGSTNGTFVGDERVDTARELADGMRIQLGKQAIVRFSLQDRLEQEASARLYEATVRDALTGLHNRRHLEAQLRTELAYAERHNTPLSVLVLDVDHFKRVNDTYGHPAGDEVLRGLGAILQSVTRTEDVAARYGGEEFVVLARAIDREGALTIAERIRSRVDGAHIAYGGQMLATTVSVGVATAAGGVTTAPEALLAAADAALYRAKRAGRNRVEFNAVR